ncbi:hypothetical protein [Acrocarpospora sp. B8E8]|uniref:hypothetical protein n=1 Tax=Acrocarpospora sp. B8E8 TaxID=3153572 RepID=UPI00325EF4B0
MSNSFSGTVRCPICLEQINWRQAKEAGLFVFDEDSRRYEPLERRRGESEQSWLHRTANAWIRCTNSDFYRHFLPVLYGAYGEPIIIVAVGTSNSGKTHLLTMLAAELERGTILAGKLSFQPLDPTLGQIFRTNYVRPLIEERQRLPYTGPTDDVFFMHAWRGYNHQTGRPFVLAFFDFSGEVLHRDNPPLTLNAASALIFLADPELIPGFGKRRSGSPLGDPTFSNICARLKISHENERFIPLPIATVISKSDLLQYQMPEVARWLLRDDDTDLSTVEQESEDVYAFLAIKGGSPWLMPTHEFVSSTLHFVSATGTSAKDGYFPERQFGPRRVLRPLLSLLARTGVLKPGQLQDNRSE